MNFNKQFILNKKPRNPRNVEYDEDIPEPNQIQLGYFVNSRTFHQYTVPIDEDFVEPSYYRNVVSMLEDADEGDTCIFKISSRGGSLSGLQTLLEAVKHTQAYTVAVLVGQCASAASILAMHTDDVVVTDSADMLAHFISYNTGGKGADIASHVAHITKTAEKLIRSTYEDFLTEKEIDAIIDGKEMYMDADEIRERLAERETARVLKQEHTQDEAAIPVQAKPKRKPAKPV